MCILLFAARIPLEHFASVHLKLIFSASNKNKKRTSTLFKKTREMGCCASLAKITSILLLVFSVYWYHVLYAGPFTPLTCTLFKVNCIDPAIEGTVAAGYEQVREKFENNFKDGNDIGSCVVTYGSYTFVKNRNVI